MTQPTVFVVTGSVGEYSDRSEWPARVFTGRGLAQIWAETMDALGREHVQKFGTYGDSSDECKANIQAMCERDPKWNTDYPGPATYTVEEVPFNVP